MIKFNYKMSFDGNAIRPINELSFDDDTTELSFEAFLNKSATESNN